MSDDRIGPNEPRGAMKDVVYGPGDPQLPALSTQVGGNHYKKYPIQPMEFFRANREHLDWQQCEVIKYVIRHADKNGRQDLEKAIHILTDMLENLYPEGKLEQPTITYNPDTLKKAGWKATENVGFLYHSGKTLKVPNDIYYKVK